MEEALGDTTRTVGYTSRVRRSFQHIVIALALLITQQGAQLHWLLHLQRGLAVAEQAGKKAPPLNHPVEQCIAFHAVGSALPCSAPDLVLADVAFFADEFVASPVESQTRVVFRSRAPPSVA